MTINLSLRKIAFWAAIALLAVAASEADRLYHDYRFAQQLVATCGHPRPMIMNVNPPDKDGKPLHFSVVQCD